MGRSQAHGIGRALIQMVSDPQEKGAALHGGVMVAGIKSVALRIVLVNLFPVLSGLVRFKDLCNNLD